MGNAYPRPCNKNDFVITASIDGIIKFWKRIMSACLILLKVSGTTAVQLQLLPCLLINAGWLQGSLITIKIFDVENFDMIQIIKYPFIVGQLLWWKSFALGESAAY